MTRYQIYCGGGKAHVVIARSASDAVKRWLADQAYESLNHAAREYFCEPDEIEARPVGKAR